MLLYWRCCVVSSHRQSLCALQSPLLAFAIVFPVGSLHIPAWSLSHELPGFGSSTGGLPDLRIELDPFSRYIIPKINEEKLARVRSTCAKSGEARYCQDSSPTRFPFNLYGRICDVWSTQEAWQRFGARRSNWRKYQHPRAHIKSLSSSDTILPVCQLSHAGIVSSGNGGSPHETGV